MASAYVYVVDRDFGFAPNPFHGVCTLATCKPGIRGHAEIGDWVVGVGGGRLNATGRCIYAMRVTGKITFDEYWANATYIDKKPIRNGSNRMLVGDNIYHIVSGEWQQSDSHHSNSDGSKNVLNVRNDTKSQFVLISRHFYYFGKSAPIIPASVLDALKYKNGRNYRVFDFVTFQPFIIWLQDSFGSSLNTVIDDPFDFAECDRRYSGDGSKLV